MNLSSFFLFPLPTIPPAFHLDASRSAGAGQPHFPHRLLLRIPIPQSSLPHLLLLMHPSPPTYVAAAAAATARFLQGSGKMGRSRQPLRIWGEGWRRRRAREEPEGMGEGRRGRLRRGRFDGVLLSCGSGRSLGDRDGRASGMRETREGYFLLRFLRVAR